MPLSDLVVVDLTIARAGPTAVRYLADWGAKVLRVEASDPTVAMATDPRTGDYINLHRSKHLVQLDLRTEDDRAKLYRVIDQADILVENYRVPVKYKLGVDYETVAARNPRLIYASISGYGQDGPYGDRGAVDQIIQGLGGLMSITGTPGGEPTRAGIAVSDLAAGHQLVIGILLALRQREATGQGQWVQVSLLESMISFLDFQAARWTVDGKVPQSEGNHHPTSVPMGAFTAADGYLNVAASSDRLFGELCAAVERPDLGADPRFATVPDRYRNRVELWRLLDEVFSQKPRAHWLALLTAQRIPCGPVLAIDEVFADPQVSHLDLLQTVDHPVRGPVDIIRNTVRLSATEARKPFTSPMPGADFDEVMAAMGLD